MISLVIFSISFCSKNGEIGKDRISLINISLSNSVCILKENTDFGGIKSQGIKLFCWYMIGLPYETERAIKEMIALHKRISPDAADTSTFIPPPGTQLYELCLKEKFIDAWQPSNYEDESMLSLPSLANEKLLLYKEYLITLSQPPSSSPLSYTLLKLNIRNKAYRGSLCFLRKALYKLKRMVLYDFYPKYSLQY